MRASALSCSLAVLSFCAACATTAPEVRHLSKQRAAKPSTCRIDFLPFALGEAYEELGTLDMKMGSLGSLGP
ncbi:MAG TPA: hypothetical protein VK447_09150, partial [Myxococcaceae bacterium]|nr:hypothetical protein [Myxococcaceae bacterium]